MSKKDKISRNHRYLVERFCDLGSCHYKVTGAFVDEESANIMHARTLFDGVLVSKTRAIKIAGKKMVETATCPYTYMYDAEGLPARLYCNDFYWSMEYPFEKLPVRLSGTNKEDAIRDALNRGYHI